MSTETNYNFYLVADAKDTGIKTHQEAHEVLVQLAAVDEETKGKEKKNFFCFWGCYGEGLSKKPSSSRSSGNYVEGIDGKYYLEETNFTIVKGYEAVPFSLAVDKSVYHVGPYQPGRSDVKVPTGDDGDDGSSSTTATRNDDAADDDDTKGNPANLKEATKLVLTYQNSEGLVYEEAWYRKSGGGDPDDPDNPSAPGEGDTAIVASEANQIYIIYCGLVNGSGSSSSSRGADNEYYSFAFQELKEGIYVWSLKYRLNVFKADYSSTKPNDYSLTQVDKELNGTYPGLK